MPSPAGRKPVRPRCCLRTEGSECRGGGRGGRRVCPGHWGPQASAWLCWTTSSWCTRFPEALRLRRENPICRRSVCLPLSPVTWGVQSDSKGQSVGRMCPSALLRLPGGPRGDSWLPSGHPSQSWSRWFLRGVSFPKIRVLTPQVPAWAPPPWRSIPWPLSLHLLGGSNLESYVWALGDSPGSFSPWASVQLFPYSVLSVWNREEFCFPSRPRLMGREWEKCWALLPGFSLAIERASLPGQTTYPGLRSEPTLCWAAPVVKKLNVPYGAGICLPAALAITLRSDTRSHPASPIFLLMLQMFGRSCISPKSSFPN